MKWWSGISQRITKHLWLNLSGRGNPSVTYSLGKGARINWSPKWGFTFRFSKRLK